MGTNDFKDYSLRAKDHNEKKRRMKALRQKAADRNPDEFAFGMMSSTTKGGVRIAKRGAENGTTGSLSMDVAKLLKTQDAGYLQTILQQTKREREKVEEEAVLAEIDVKAIASAAASEARKSFDEDGNEVRAPRRKRLPSPEEESDDEMHGSDGLSKGEIQLRRRKRRAQEVLRNRLEALVDRERNLAAGLDQLDLQRAKMHNTVGGTNKDGVKFKVRERKR